MAAAAAQGSISPPSSGGGERPRATAKWGAACAACAAAKAKCIRTNAGPGAKCDRCERLSKHCSGQVHRPRKKRAGKPSKTAQLEERLNGLVDLIRASRELPGPVQPDAAPAPPVPSAAAPVAGDAGVSPLSDPSTAASAGPSPTDPRGRRSGPSAIPSTIPPTYNECAPASCICRPEPGETGAGADAVEPDDVLLAKFRRHMHPLLPFVVLPADATAAQLAAERPVLLMAVRIVTSVDNYRAMQGLLCEFVQHVSEQMLLRAARSLDLLQGLLTVLSWYHHHCMLHGQLNNLLHLATALLSDLNLNRAPRVVERADVLALQPGQPSPRTHEERRALLGLWYVRSSVALCFQKTEPLRFSPYIRQCLQELEGAADADADGDAGADAAPTDAALVALVRLQHLAEKIAAFRSHRDEATDDLPCIPRAPWAAYQIVFRAELDRFVDALPADLQKHRLIESHVASMALRLYEPPLLDLALLKKLAASLSADASPMLASSLDTLFNARNAVKGFFDQFFAVPVRTYQWLPLPIYLHLIHGIIMISRWARLVGPVRPGPPPSARHAEATAAPGRKAAAAAAAVSPAETATASASSASASASASASTTTPVSASAAASTAPTPPGGPGAEQRLPAGAAGASGPGLAGLAALPAIDARELQSDPSLGAALARVRELLRQQPDLALDLPAILATIWDRFEQSNRETRAAAAARLGSASAAAAAAAGSRGMNVWDMTARKIAIMRYKIMHYLEGGGPAFYLCQEARSTDLRLPQDLLPSQEAYSPPPPKDAAGYLPQPDHPQQQLSGPPAAPFPPAPFAPPSLAPHGLAAAAAAAGPMAPPLVGGLPADLGLYGLGGGGLPGTATADTMGYGLGNLAGWDADPLWGSDLFGAVSDPGLWAENMDWVATLG